MTGTTTWHTIAATLVLALAPLLAAAPARAAAGGFAAPPVFSADGLAGAVFLGGSVDQLETAAAASGASGAWAQDARGGFVLLVVGGPSFVNEGFRATFAGGFPSAAAITLTRAARPAATGVPAALPTAQPTPQPTPTPQPAPTPQAAPAAVGTWIATQPPRGASGGEWIAVGAPGGKTILARVIRPTGDGPFPAVVLLHGQSGFSNAYLGLGEEIARSGYVTVVGCWFAGNYDGTSNPDAPAPVTLSDGIECPEGPTLKSLTSPAAVDDVGALIAATKTLPGVKRDRVALVGNSRGSVIAVLAGAANRDPVQAIGAIGGAPPGGPILALGLTAPLLLLQGEEDSVVPVVNAQALEAALTALGRTAQSYYYPRQGHGLLFDQPTHADVVSRLVAFLRTQLGG